MRRRNLLFAALISVIMMTTLTVVGTAAPPNSATVQFGQGNVGSPFPAPSGHDSSTHAKDSMVPRTVVISQWGTVTFNTFGVHQVAIYKPGTKPGDINVSVTTSGGVGCPPVPLIDDGDDRLAVLSDQPCASGSTAPSFMFDEPGRYLVICTFKPHFADNDMFGWVIVR